MSRYAYPAVFTPEENGQFSVNFPDLDGCYTCGDDMKEIPEPSAPGDLTLEKNEFVNYVACDTLEYRKMHNNKAVKKTLTIPEWLNESAMAMGLNFSQVLQDALMDKVGAR